MIIKQELAQSIVNQMMKIVDHNINIMNEEGIIVASGDPKRLYKKHQGAIEAIQLKREKIIYDTNSDAGILPGVNLPIEFNNQVIGAVGITGDPKQIYKLSHIIKITVEALLRQQYLSDRLRYKQKVTEEWVYDLVNDGFDNVNDLEARAELLKIDTRSSCNILLIEVDGLNRGDAVLPSMSYDHMQQQEARIMQVIERLNPETLFAAYLGGGIFLAAVPVIIPEGVEKGLRIADRIHRQMSKEWTVRIAISRAYSGVPGYRRGYQEAWHCLRIMAKFAPDKPFSHIQEWGIVHFISEIAEATRDDFLKRFFADKGMLPAELQLTLESFLANNQDIGLTSTMLHIHRNTLQYRLDKVKQLWGLDPRKFQDALVLQLICWSLKLRG